MTMLGEKWIAYSDRQKNFPRVGDRAVSGCFPSLRKEVSTTTGFQRQTRAVMTLHRSEQRRREKWSRYNDCAGESSGYRRDESFDTKMDLVDAADGRKHCLIVCASSQPSPRPENRVSTSRKSAGTHNRVARRTNINCSQPGTAARNAKWNFVEAAIAAKDSLGGREQCSIGSAMMDPDYMSSKAASQEENVPLTAASSAKRQTLLPRIPSALWRPQFDRKNVFGPSSSSVQGREMNRDNPDNFLPEKEHIEM